jgi:hypothetical protein
MVQTAHVRDCQTRRQVPVSVFIVDDKARLQLATMAAGSFPAKNGLSGEAWAGLVA